MSSRGAICWVLAIACLLLWAGCDRQVELTGRVLYNDQPDPQSRVTLELWWDDMFHRWLSKRCDEEGRFHFESLPTGRYRVTVESLRDLESPPTEIREIRLKKDRAMDFEIRRGSVVGRVVDAQGRAVPEIGVLLVRQEAGTDRWSPFEAWGPTDSTGGFDIQGIPEGEYHLVARSVRVGVQTRQVAVKAPRTHLGDVQLERGKTAIVDFRSFGTFQGVILQGVFRDGRGNHMGYLERAERTAHGGAASVEIPAIPPGSEELILLPRHHATIRVPLKGEVSHVSVRLIPAATLIVKVPALAGQAEGRLSMRDAHGNPPLLLQVFEKLGRDRVMTEDGIVEVLDAPPGTWTVTVQGPQGRAWSRQIVVALGGVQEIVLE